MATYVLVELADDGTTTATPLTDPVSVTTTVDVPLATLLPPAPAPADAPLDPQA